MLTKTTEWLTLRYEEFGIMRSFRGYKASTLPTWMGNRVVASSKASLGQTVEELRQAETEALSNCLGPGSGASLSKTSCLKAVDCRPTRRVATFSTGGVGKPPSRKKDPSFLLGAGWEAGGENVAVAVWWDFENCNVPLGIEVYKVGVNIVSGLRMCGFKGPVSISAYGDTLQLSRSSQEALASTGIRLHHIASVGKDSSDRALLVDLLLWTLEHPPPAHLFLISGDRDFSNALHRLRMMNYNILLACPAGTIVSPALLGAATQVWQWNSLVRGEGLLSATPSPDPKPPDGPTPKQTTPKPVSPTSPHPGLRGPDGNGPLIDVGGKSNPPSVTPLPTLRPKAVQVHSKSPNGAANSVAPQQGLKTTDDKRECPEEGKLSSGPNSNSPLREVPTKVMQQFRDLLVSYPDGMKLADLQANISNKKIPFESDYYGHRKIVPFLLSIPHVVRLEKVLQKDNKSWSYSLTSTTKPAKKGSNTTADDTLSTKDAKAQEAQKIDLPEASEVGSSSSERPPKTSAAHHQIPAPQSAIEPQAHPKDLEKSKKEVFQSNEESADTSFQVEKLDPREAHVVEENAPSPGLGSSIANKAKEGSSDVGQKKMVRPEDCSTNSVKGGDKERRRIELGAVVAEGVLHKPLMDDNKQRSHGSAEDKVEAVRDRVASREDGGHLGDKEQSTILVDKAETEDSKRSWKTWLWGRTGEKSPSPATGRPIIDSSVSPAVYDLSDLDNVTWKELLSWPRKPTQFSKDSESELTEEQKLEQGKVSSVYLLEDLKEYLCSAEGTAILSNAPNLMAVFDTIRTTGPHKFRGLRSSQIAELIDQLAKTEEGFGDHFSLAPDSHSSDGDEGECILPKEEREKMKSGLQDEEPTNGSRDLTSKVIDELSSNRSVECPSLSKNYALSVLRQEDQIRSSNGDSILFKDPGCMSSTTSLTGTESSGPSLGEFQEWFLATVKEAYKSSERTQRIGFNLSMVKPDFEREFGVRLNPQVYGFVKIQDLVESIRAVRVSRPRQDLCVVHLLKDGESLAKEDQRGETPKVNNVVKGGRWPQMYDDCIRLVRELMVENPEGLPGTKLKPLFISRFQYPLDHKREGFAKMSDLLRLMPDVVSVNGKYLVPSEELLLSLKGEAIGKESTRAGGLIVEEDNVANDAGSQSRQDAEVEKVGVKSPESWGEIDTEGNGCDDIGEATLDDRQGQHVCESSASEKLSISENAVPQALISTETNSAELPDRATFPAEGSAVEEFQTEVLSPCLSANHEGKDDTNFRGGEQPLAGNESLLLSDELLVNVTKITCEVDAGSGDDLEPLISSLEGREWHQPVLSDDDRDTCDEEESLFVAETEKGAVDRSEEGFATVVMGDSNKVEREGHITLAAINGQGVEPKTIVSFEVFQNIDRGTAPGSPPSNYLTTSRDVVLAGLDDKADCRQSQESEVSQSVRTSEGKEEDFSTVDINSGLELVHRNSGEKHMSTQESITDTGNFIGQKISDTELIRDKKSPEGHMKPDDDANSLPECLSSKVSKKDFVGLMEDDSTDRESKASSLFDKESSEKPWIEADNADGLGNSSKEKSLLSVSERDGSASVDHDQPPQEEESQTSAAVSPHDEETLQTAAEATHEGRKEGHHARSTSAQRASLKSIWKRIFS